MKLFDGGSLVIIFLMVVVIMLGWGRGEQEEKVVTRDFVLKQKKEIEPNTVLPDFCYGIVKSRRALI